jgi:HAD superfamily hydrolase (TIGR01549 family)
MIKGLIFDLDGTLIKLPIRNELLLNNLRKFFDTTDEFKPLIPSIVKKSQGDRIKLKNAFNLICDEELVAANNFELIDNAIQILNYFKSKNYTIGLVTMQCRKAVEKILSSIKIYEIFSSIITRDENYDRLEQIKKMFEALNLSPKEVLMIGDRIHDVESAHKAGCKAVLVHEHKSHSNPETLILKKISELKNLEF